MRIAILILSCLLMSPVTFAQVSSVLKTSQTSRQVILVSGSGQIEVMPDMATIEMAVITKAKVAKEAQAANAMQVNQLREAVLGPFHLEKNDFKTVSYIITPEYDDNTRELKDYSVRQDLQISLKDMARVGDLLDVVGASGATSVDFVQFGLIDRKPYEIQALKKAMEDAQTKAEAIASAMGKKVTRVLRVSEGQYHVEERREAVQKDRAPGTEIYPGSVNVMANLNVEYEF